MEDERERRVDAIITSMVAGSAGISLIPAEINWLPYLGILVTGVIAIASCYGIELSKSDATKLIKQLILSAGFGFVALTFGDKFAASFLELTGIGYPIGVAIDAVISSAAAFAIGYTAKEYFEGERDKKKLGKILREKFHNYKQQSKKQ